MVGFNYNGTDYYYRKNLQGDILAIVNASGSVVAKYDYDAWGYNLAVKDANGNDVSDNTTHIANVNPFRYRGYYYDTETKLYYLNSRYYDPEVGRFINADDVQYLGENGDFVNYNLFAYCENNPTNRFDENGNWSLPNWAKIVIGVAAIAVGVIVTAATGGAALPALIAGVKTAVVVGAISAGTNVAKTAVDSIKNGDSFDEFAEKAIDSAVDGFCDGFMTGGIMSGASMTFGSILKNATGFKFGTTPKPQYGRVNMGYGTPKTNGNTLLSIQNSSGKSIFRIEADACNMLHLHYGKTKSALAKHRTAIVNFIAGVFSSD